MLTPSSPYRDALEAMERTVHARARKYRKLMLGVVAVIVGSIALAVVQRSWLALTLISAVFPLVGVFLLADATLVARWQRGILREWAEDRLELSAFREAARHLHTIPRRTLDGMLATLPAGSGDAERDRRPAAARAAVADVAGELHGYHFLRIGFSIGVQALMLGILGLAVVRWSAAPLWGLFAVPVLYGTRDLLITRRFRAVRRRLAPRVAEGAVLFAFRDAAAGLDWHGVPNRERRRILDFPG